MTARRLDKPASEERRLAAAVVLSGELIILGYAATWAFLLTRWTGADGFWLLVAVKFVAMAAAAAVLAAGVFQGNRRLFPWVGLPGRRLAAYTAGAVGALVVGAAAAGTALAFAATPH